MSSANPRPSWMTDELEEEWPASPSPPPEDARQTALPPLSSSSSFKNGSLRVAKRIGTGSLRSLDYGDGSLRGSVRHPRPPSPPSPTRARKEELEEEGEEEQSNPGGTVVVRTDVEDRPFNPLTPAKGAASRLKGGAAGPGSGMKGLFSPLALESMFEPPSPPQPDQQEEDHQQQPLSPPNLTFNSPPSSEERNQRPSSSSQSPSPSPSFPRSQQQHLPPRPSRLATAFGPDDLTASTVDVHQDDEEEEQEEEEYHSEDEILESDIPNLGAFNGRKQSAGFEFSCKPPPPPPRSYSGSPQSFGSLISPLRQNGSFGAVQDHDEEEEEEEDEYERDGDEEPTQPTTRRTSGGGRTTTTSGGSASLNNTGYARNYGPPLSPAVGSSGSARPSGNDNNPRRLTLFESQYDTFTREFMTDVIDQIDHNAPEQGDGSPLSGSSRSGGPGSGSGGSNESDSPTSSNPSDIPFRAIKRVKLSPAARAVSGASSSSASSSASSRRSSLDRLRMSRGGASAASSGGRPMRRDWEKESGEMLRKLKEMGKGNPASAASRGGWGRGGSYSFSEREATGSDEGGSTEEDGAGGTVRRKVPLAKDADSPPTPTHSLPPTPPLQTRAQFASTSTNKPLIKPPTRQSAYVLEAANVLARIHSVSASDDSNTTASETSSVASTSALPPVPPPAPTTVPTSAGGGGRRVSNDLPSRFPSTGRAAAARAAAAQKDKEGKENDAPKVGGGGGRFEEMKGKMQSPRKLLRRLSAADEVDKELAVGAADVSLVKEEDEEEGELTGAKAPTPPTTFSLPLVRPGRGGPPPARPTSQQTTRSSTTGTESTLRPSAPSTLRGRFPSATSTTVTAPPPPPSSASTAAPTVQHVAPADDLNRFVSSSTALTTIGPSTISSASFIKHAGGRPPPAGGRMISIPFDGGNGMTPRVVGRMEYDQEKMMWVKVRDPKGERETRALSEEDEDPFKDMDSTRGSGGMRKLDEENEEAEEEQEKTFISEEEEHDSPTKSSPPPTPSNLNARREFTRTTHRTPSFDSTPFDDAAEGPREDGFPVPGATSFRSPTVEEERDSVKSFQFPSSSSISLSPPAVQHPPPLIHHAQSAPSILPMHPEATSTPLPSHRQVARIASGGGLRPFVTPVSVLKKRSPGTPATGGGGDGGETPHRRSVSFSDGRKAGKIKDLRIEEEDGRKGGLFDKSLASGNKSVFLPSARGARIQNMLEGLGEDEVSASIASLHEQTPSKLSSSRAFPSSADNNNPARTTSNEYSKDATDSSFSTHAPNTTARSMGAGGKSFHYGNGGRRGNPGDATFLTEWSFGATRDRLVEIITDVHPFVVNWEEMTEIDLEGKGAGSVARLKEFLPKLVEVNLNRNDLDYLSGLPTSVETLHVAFNRLSGITAVAHLPNLQYLDLSNNQLDVVHQLQCLRHLREVKLDNNAIEDLTPLFIMSGLTKVSAAGNLLESMDFSDARWSRLESLDLGRNKLQSVTGVHHLTSLTSLTLDDNQLRTFDSSRELPKLRSLKLSKNRLTRLDAGQFPQLRTLYADNNRLQTINCSGRRTRIERLSLRSQETGQLSLSPDDLRDVKRLFVSGNPLPSSFFNQQCNNLVYIEMAACKLSHLPPYFTSFAPNVRSLNINYNFFSDITNLGGLKQLTKLSVVGSRLEATKPVMRMLKTLPSLEMLDLRMNPCTLAMYLPLIISNISSALEPSSSTSPQTSPTETGFAASPPWTELDAAFRQSLPDVWYVRRLAHRGLVMQACPRVKTLDGVEISGGERRKAAELMETVLRRSQEARS